MNKRIITIIVCLIILLYSASVYSAPPSPEESLISVADWLVESQRDFGAWGYSIAELNYNGPIIAGLVEAYNITNNITYKESAEKGANFIILFSDMNFLGDEDFE